MIELPAQALIGVVHLAPLPGAVGSSELLSAIIARARDEAAQLEAAGFDAIIVENLGDAPFHASTVEPHTVAMMTRCAHAVVDATDVPVGINVLRNDALAALGIAAATHARFIRSNVHVGVFATDQGIIEGRAAATLQYRRRLCPEVAIFADVHVKHATPLSQLDIALAAEETAYRGAADAVIVSGPTTARGAAIDDLQRVKNALPDKPVLVGSGVTPDNVSQYLAASDGAIVGSCLRQDGQPGRPLDAQRVQNFAQAAQSRR